MLAASSSSDRREVTVRRISTMVCIVVLVAQLGTAQIAAVTTGDRAAQEGRVKGTQDHPCSFSSTKEHRYGPPSKVRSHKSSTRISAASS